MAEVLVGAAGAALMSPAAKKLRDRAQRFAVLAAHSVSETAQGAAASIAEAFEQKETKPARRANGRTTAPSH